MFVVEKEIHVRFNDYKPHEIIGAGQFYWFSFTRTIGQLNNTR